MPVSLILGLGNPGPEYASTRHNIGFEIAAEMVRRRGNGLWSRLCDCEVSVITAGRLVVVARPQRYMNRSGEVARQLLAELEIDAAAMLVVVDDVDLPLGSLRVRKKGGPGTHNGLRNLVAEIGSQFPRLRVGVRGTGSATSLADYVLSPFDGDEAETVRGMITRGADAIDAVLQDGLDRAMSRFNRSDDHAGG